MTTHPRIRTASLNRPNPDGRSFLVSVYDRLDQLICWCGPYTLRERDDCINLFRSGGWRRRNFGSAPSPEGPLE